MYGCLVKTGVRKWRLTASGGACAIKLIILPSGRQLKNVLIYNIKEMKKNLVASTFVYFVTGSNIDSRENIIYAQK